MPATSLTSLPSEVIVAIYQRMSIREVIQTRQACKLLADIANEPSIWKVMSDQYAESTNENINKIAEGLPPSELQTLVLRRASSDYGWKKRAEPVVRNATNNMVILDGGKLLLPGGRWLFTWGDRFEFGMGDGPPMARTVFAYDLAEGAQITGPKAIFKSSKFNDRTFDIRFVAAQVNYSDDGTAGFIVAVASNKMGTIVTGLWGSDIFLEIFHFTFDGQASPPIRALQLQSGPLDRLDLRDDFVLLEHGGTYEILNWRQRQTARGFSTQTLVLADPSLVLQGHKVYYEANSGDDRLPLWSLPLGDDDFVIESNYTNFSEPQHIQGETRIAIRVRSIIYGLVIPDDTSEPPSIHELARFEQKYLHDIRHQSVALSIDKLVAAGGYGVVRFVPLTAAFSWPSANERPFWRAPFIVPIARDLEAYRVTSAGLPRCSMVIDPVFGRIVTGAKFTSAADRGGLNSDEGWTRTVAWSVVDFAAPHYLLT
ncbi:hypothetical protein D9619_003728 [Psilocybe cf. subviscida]|uniref:F-box domain-containing protein n=1 Tax=Psilocybe cf. subviscida TaxID=2480587 RepID=A0A8H5EU44_9AGAR|nr:hypothetical protein D9619_003728 [Psilocybe cf. subviscida]